MERTTKKQIITKHQSHQKDTGSPQVQVAILTERILSLTAHLKIHNKDNHSRRGLLLMVGKRRKLLNYLKNTKPSDYQKIIAELNLRK